MAVQPLASQVGVAPACRALGVPRASFYRRQRPAPGHQQPRPTPARALCASERAHVLDVLASPRFVDRSPAEVVATLLDEGQYLCAERTMYRILAANQPVRERRNQRSHPCYTKPELVATGCPSHLFHLSQKPWNFASPPDTLSGMHKIIEIFAYRAALHTEILALRQQVAVLKRKRPRPSLRKADRVFWVILSCLWPGWRHALVIVRPETVIGWHRKGFRLFWTWKSRRRKPGRPPVSREIRHLVRRMSRENTRWGAPRIHGELLKLGFSISQAAVSKYMVRYPSPPSQSWRTFLTNHADCLASIDFFVVPTATFHLLFGFIVLHHERRQIVHFGVTANPTMAWVAQQIREAFPWGTAPRYLIRDRDGAYGQSFRSTVTAMGVEEVVTAPRSPWQNPYVERLIGSVRRECLDHSIILNERHLRRILGSYLDYYHGSRTHLSLGKDTPDGRPVQPAGSGTVVSLPKVGGLHHRYERLAA